MTEVYVSGYKKGQKSKVSTMNVHFMGEDYVWFEFILKDGTNVQTLPLKGEI